MAHRIVCLTLLLLMSVLKNVGAQNRYDRALQERAIRLEPFIVAAANRYDVDARILRVICFMESRYHIDAVSPKGARGPMQFTADTAARYGLRDPHDPEEAIDAAARYFRDLLRKFGGRIDLALAAYNAGEGAVVSFMTGKSLRLRDGRIVNPRGVVTGGVPPYAETHKYVRSILILLNRGVTTGAEVLNWRLRIDERRDLTLDVLDLFERPQKFSHGRASSFIEVP